MSLEITNKRAFEVIREHRESLATDNNYKYVPRRDGGELFRAFDRVLVILKAIESNELGGQQNE